VGGFRAEERNPATPQRGTRKLELLTVRNFGGLGWNLVDYFSSGSHDFFVFDLVSSRNRDAFCAISTCEPPGARAGQRGRVPCGGEEP